MKKQSVQSQGFNDREEMPRVSTLAYQPKFTSPVFLALLDGKLSCLEPTYGCSGDCGCDGN